MVDPLNPNSGAYSNYPVGDAASLLAAAGAKSAAAGVGSLPPLSQEDIARLADTLPKLAVPFLAGNISLEELVKAIGMETRQVAAKTGLESLKVKAEEREEANQKKLEEVQERVKKLHKLAKLGPFMKALKWIGKLFAAIAAVATAAIGVLTANPLLIAGAAIMLTMMVNSIMSDASGGKVSIAAGVAALAKQCGADEQTAQWIGMGVEIGITVAGAVLSFGAGVAGSAASAAEMAGKVAMIAARVSQFASLASGLTTVAQGGAGIAEAVYTSDITKSKAAQKDLEAILARIAEAQDIETKFLESVMKRAEELLATVKDIVQGNVEAQAAILGAQAPAVA